VTIDCRMHKVSGTLLVLGLKSYRTEAPVCTFGEVGSLGTRLALHPGRTRRTNRDVGAILPGPQIHLQNMPPDFITNFANSRRNCEPATRECERFEELKIGLCIALIRQRKTDQITKGANVMDRMLVVVFDNEAKAYEGKRALVQLDREGSISDYASVVLTKHADGTATVKEEDDSGPIGTLVGTSLGSLIGLLGGPAGLAIGSAVGLLAGSTADLDNARIGDDFIDDVTKQLLPNKVAVVAEIDEDWTTPVDTRMEAIGGIVFRRALSDAKHTIHEENVNAMKADLAQMKAEQAKSHADRKAKLQEKINQLDSKIQTQLQKAKDRRVAAERQAQAKVAVLKAKAEAAKAKAS